MLRILRRPHHSPASSDSESIDQELARGLPHRSERSRDPVRPSGYCFLGSPLFQRRTRRLLVYGRAPNSSSMRVSTKTNETWPRSQSASGNPLRNPTDCRPEKRSCPAPPRIHPSSALLWAKIRVFFSGLSGRAMARSGLRMMPPFPSPSLKFRKAGFPRSGFKASISDRAFPSTASLAQRSVCLRPSYSPLPPLISPYCAGKRGALEHRRSSS